MCNSKGVQTTVVFVMCVLAVIVIAATVAGLHRSRRIHSVARTSMPERDGVDGVKDSATGVIPVFSELLRDTLRRDLGLAAEHVHSIRCLLEIAGHHQQPIPPAALTNLEMVLKHLVEMQRRIDAAAQETAPKPALSAAAHRPTIQSPLHPRPPSFGCHVSPSGRSTPCD